MIRRLATGVLLAAAIPLATAAGASAATFSVDTQRDSVAVNPASGVCADSSGNCSLRAAVQTANATAGDDTINFATAGLEYQLRNTGPSEDAAATGDLDITDGVTINGNSSKINGLNADRVFDVSGLNPVVLREMTIVKGSPPATQSGGGVRVTSTNVTITSSKLRNNGVSGAGASGGGVFNDGGDVTLNGGSVITNNAAERAGGGIEANGGVTTVLLSTLSFNSTGPSPGNGGGLHLTGAGTVNVINSTVVQNSASQEGGGLWNSATGTMTVQSSRVANNTASAAAGTPDQGGGGIFSDGGDTFLQGGAVANNSATGALGSGGGVMIVSAAETWVLDINGTRIEGNNAVRAGGGIEARAGAIGDTVTIDNARLLRNSTGTSPGNGGGMHVTSTVAGAGAVTVDDTRVVDNNASREGGGLWNDTGSMTVTNTTLNDNDGQGPAADDGGGALFNNGGTMSVQNSEIRNNTASGTLGSGGGAFSLGGTFSAFETVFKANQASRAGGAIEAATSMTGSPAVSVGSDSFLTKNTAGINGGGLHLTGAGTVDVSNSTVDRNTAVAEGGGLWNSAAGSMTVTNADIAGNVATGTLADQGGGGLFQEAGGAGTLTMNGGVVRNNSAPAGSGSGGGLLNDQGSVTINDTRFQNNSAARAGGAIEANLGTTDLNAATLADNSTGANPGNGGGLHLTGAGTVTIDDGRIVRNDASNEGGGVWCSSAGNTQINNTVIQNNTAPTGPNVFFQPPGAGTCTVDGTPVPPGPPGI